MPFLCKLPFCVEKNHAILQKNGKMEKGSDEKETVHAFPAYDGAPYVDAGGEEAYLLVPAETGKTYSASPTLSLRDGSVWMNGAYDFTEYPAGFERES